MKWTDFERANWTEFLGHEPPEGFNPTSQQRLAFADWLDSKVDRFEARMRREAAFYGALADAKWIERNPPAEPKAPQKAVESVPAKMPEQKAPEMTPPASVCGPALHKKCLDYVLGLSAGTIVKRGDLPGEESDKYKSQWLKWSVKAGILKETTSRGVYEK